MADDARELLAELQRRIEGRKLFQLYSKRYDPEKNVNGAYPWQVEFHNAGAQFSQRAIIAANQVGKTISACAEDACHLTGLYPEWWEGKRFAEPTQGWIGSESNEASRDIVQLVLLGQPGNFGTGLVPRELLAGDPKFRQAGVADVVDGFYVKHISGGLSYASFKTYEQGRTKWQGTKKHFVHLDEEPPMDIFNEALARTINTGGLIYITFTPLKGPSEVVQHFLEGGANIYVKNVTWDDAPHISEERKRELLEQFPEHERDARAKGIPLMGSGMVFPVPDEQILVAPFPIPEHWYRINGIDFGIDHPAAGAFCAWDKDGDTFYVYDGYKMPGQTALYHAEAMRKHGTWIPNAWPHDGLSRDKGSGKRLKNQYREHGLYMLPEPARYADEERKGHVEPALIEMLEYMQTNRFRVFSTVREFFDEKRLYHRKDGQVVKQNDDFLSAVRYAFVSRRFAKVRPVGVKRIKFNGPIVGQKRWRARN